MGVYGAEGVKRHEGHLGLVLGLVLSLENILKAENMAACMHDRNTYILGIFRQG